MNLKDLPEAKREVVFTFPSLPPTALYQNRVESTHWRTRHKAAKEAREEAYFLALSMYPSVSKNGRRMFAHPFETCEVEIAVTVPDKRRRDLGGILSAVKSYLDGLVDAGVFPDDDYTHVQRLSATVTYVKGVSETRIIVRER